MLFEINLLSQNHDFMGTCKVSKDQKTGELPKLVAISRKVNVTWVREYFLQDPNSGNVYIRIEPTYADYTVKWNEPSNES